MNYDCGHHYSLFLLALFSCWRSTDVFDHERRRHVKGERKHHVRVQVLPGGRRVREKREQQYSIPHLCYSFFSHEKRSGRQWKRTSVHLLFNPHLGKRPSVTTKPKDQEPQDFESAEKRLNAGKRMRRQAINL
jgi:hypothetical protein